MQDTLLKAAEFDPAVKRYWMAFWLFLAVVTLAGIPFLPLVALLVWIMAQRILNAMSAELFERRLVVKRGAFFRSEKTIPLEKITAVGLTQGPLMRAFGLYRLDVEPAGQSGAGALVSLLGVVDAMAFRERILEQKERLQFDAETSTPSPEAPPQEDTLSALLKSVQNIERLLEARER